MPLGMHIYLIAHILVQAKLSHLYDLIVSITPGAPLIETHSLLSYVCIKKQEK